MVRHVCSLPSSLRLRRLRFRKGRTCPSLWHLSTPPPVLLPRHRAHCQTLSSAHLEENSWEPQDHTINARVTLVSSQPFQKLRGSHASGKCGRHKILQKEEEIFQGHSLMHRRLLFRARHLGLFPGRKKGERFFFYLLSFLNKTSKCLISSLPTRKMNVIAPGSHERSSATDRVTESTYRAWRSLSRAENQPLPLY